MQRCCTQRTTDATRRSTIRFFEPCVGTKGSLRADVVSHRSVPARVVATFVVSRRTVEIAVEEPAEDAREALADRSERASDLGLRWWRGWDLNPRPSGYEPVGQAPGPYRPVSGGTSELGFRASLMSACVAARRPVPDRTVEATVEGSSWRRLDSAAVPPGRNRCSRSLVSSRLPRSRQQHSGCWPHGPTISPRSTTQPHSAQVICISSARIRAGTAGVVAVASALVRRGWRVATRAFGVRAP